MGDILCFTSGDRSQDGLSLKPFINSQADLGEDDELKYEGKVVQASMIPARDRNGSWNHLGHMTFLLLQSMKLNPFRRTTPLPSVSSTRSQSSPSFLYITLVRTVATVATVLCRASREVLL